MLGLLLPPLLHLLLLHGLHDIQTTLYGLVVTQFRQLASTATADAPTP
jgi:hypothetical protein